MSRRDFLKRMAACGLVVATSKIFVDFGHQSHRQPDYAETAKLLRGIHAHEEHMKTLITEMRVRILIGDDYRPSPEPRLLF